MIITNRGKIVFTALFFLPAILFYFFFPIFPQYIF